MTYVAHRSDALALWRIADRHRMEANRLRHKADVLDLEARRLDYVAAAIADSPDDTQIALASARERTLVFHDWHKLIEYPETCEQCREGEMNAKHFGAAGGSLSLGTRPPSSGTCLNDAVTAFVYGDCAMSDSGPRGQRLTQQEIIAREALHHCISGLAPAWSGNVSDWPTCPKCGKSILTAGDAESGPIWACVDPSCEAA